ncbi:MAG: TRAP transporter large permease subunit [Syntrophobacterales bacterium]|nr:TRAP transporter large permease subunit [Syntrophobacterales bacterium]
MMDTWLLTIIVFSLLVGFLLTGIPIAFVLLAMGAIGTFYVWGSKGLLMISQTAYGEATDYILLAIPLFVLMANVLKFSGMADELYEIAYRWMGRLRGGLAMGTVAICAIFAAMSGISSAATVSMGLIALPSMLSRGYDKSLALGSINAGGALGILIPPSIIMVLYGSMTDVSVGQLFAGGIIPGILLTVIFIVYIAIRCAMNKGLGPPGEEHFTLRQKIATIKGVLAPLLLVVLVLGVMYLGIATPTEAAGIGAAGAFFAAAIHRRLSWANVKKSLIDTMSLTVMIFWLIIGANTFTHFLAYAGIQDMIQKAILSLEINRWFIMIIIQGIYFILGCFLDPAGILLLTTPIFVPVVANLGFDPLWFGIVFTINMEMAYITPPFGFNLFILKGVAPPEITMTDIYESVWPFAVCQALALATVMAWPELVLYLPSLMVRT